MPNCKGPLLRLQHCGYCTPDGQCCCPFYCEYKDPPDKTVVEKTLENMKAYEERNKK